MKNITRLLMMNLLCLLAFAAISCAKGESPAISISWYQCLDQKSEFYSSEQAVRIADNVLLYQRNTGGWPSNINMARELTDEEKKQIREDKNKQDSLLDNSATYTQIRYLARVYSATKLERFKEATLNGLDYLFRAQYENGGWPQIYPSPTGYHKFITFNDDAMIGAISLLRDVAEQKPDYQFIDQQRRTKAAATVQKGIECILKCQVIVDGRRTAWCQQYDDKTFEPRPARTFEPVALTTRESVGIIQFLMSIEKPSPQVIQAVQDAVTWLDSVKLSGIRLIVKREAEGRKISDREIVEDETAPPIWSRLYQIGANIPIFGDRDSKVYFSMSDISIERRAGYAWYGYWPSDLLAKGYPAWQKKWAPEKNVLSN
jgi:PelA/Pel-15E family pectate lyase